MNYAEYLKDNTCFIVPNNIKKEILLYMSNNKMIVDVCFYAIEELKKKIYFDYNEKTIYELSKHFNLSYEDAQLMINNMYYITNHYFDDEKINKLKEMKEYLDSKKLLDYDNNFLSYLNGKQIITTYGKVDYFKANILEKLNDVKYIENKDVFKKEIYAFNFIEDEVEFVAYEIAKLIDSNVQINKIKLVNVDDTYNLFIKKIFSFYNIPVNVKERTSLYDLLIVKDFLNILNEENDKDKALDLFKEKYPLNNEKTINIYNEIIACLNDIYFINDLKKDFEYVIKKFQYSYLKNKKIDNSVECIKVEEMSDDSNYYFLIGFNNSVPKFYKDEDYLNDKIKEKLSFKKSYEINKNIKSYYLNKLNGYKNLTITYKLKDYFNSYLGSTLIDEIEGTVIKNPLIKSNVTYSSKYDKVKLSKYLDDYYKYGYKDEKLSILYNSYKSDYNTYDNVFKGLKNDKFIEYKNNKLSLSYSSLDNFYKCQFKYYLSNILNEQEDTFATKIGSLYHYVLSKIYDKDFNFETSYNEYLSTLEIGNKEQVLLIKLKEELKRDVNILKLQIDKGSFSKPICEKELKINIKSKVSVVLKGFIDKIMLSEDYKYAYLVDYKTGNPKISFEHLDYGLNMQLAIYMYLMNKSSEYANIFLVGCYLQKILDDDINKDELKLEGYTYNNMETIKMIDKNYFDESFINGVHVKKDGTLKSSDKLFDTAYYENVINIVESKIQEAIDCILNNDFTINPKIVGGNNVSCKYCDYKDICYHKYKDAIVISQEEDENEQNLD